MNPQDEQQQLVALACAARDLHGASPERERLQLGLQLAIELVPGCAHAGLMKRRQRKTIAVASSDDVAGRADAHVEEHGRGPVVDTFAAHEPVTANDLHSESRWPIWTEYVRDTLGVGAAICLPLQATTRSFGVLTLYFDAPVSQETPLVHATAFATHLALALDSVGTIEHQAVALERRTEIGQAQGILMARSGLSAEAAFAYLQRQSQTGNRKLHTIAQEVVRRRGPVPDSPVAPAEQGSASTHAVSFVAVVAAPTDAQG